MSESKALLPLVGIVGPTASGKSALGVKLAERLGGEVVACDSTQLYRGFDIGTAKPTLAERHGIQHHLIDVLEAEDDATAGRYREMVLQILQDLRKRERFPVFTVGTGLYLRALLEGLADVPQRSEELRERLRASVDGHPPVGRGQKNRVCRRTEAHPRNRSMYPRAQADIGGAQHGPYPARRLARSESRINAPARETQRTHKCENGSHARAGLGARGAGAAQ